jgi:hypothetical protein
LTPMLTTLGIQRRDRKEISRSTEDDPNCCLSVVLVEEDMSVLSDVAIRGVSCLYRSSLSSLLAAVKVAACLSSFLCMSFRPSCNRPSFVRRQILLLVVVECLLLLFLSTETKTFVTLGVLGRGRCLIACWKVLFETF